MNLLLKLAFSFILLGAGFLISDGLRHSDKTSNKVEMVKYGATRDLYSFYQWNARQDLFEFDGQFLIIKGYDQDMLVPVDRVTVEEKVEGQNGTVLIGVAYGASEKPKFDIAIKVSISFSTDEARIEFLKLLSAAKGIKYD